MFQDVHSEVSNDVTNRVSEVKEMVESVKHWVDSSMSEFRQDVRCV